MLNAKNYCRTAALAFALTLASTINVIAAPYGSESFQSYESSYDAFKHLDEIGIIGSEDEVQERIRAGAAGGVHTQIIAPLFSTPEEMQRTFNAFTANQFAF